jgi:hypothetical protein
MKFKKSSLLLIPILVFACWAAHDYRRNSKILKILLMGSAKEIETQCGDPMIVESKFPPQMGIGICTQEEMTLGINIRIYSLTDLPPMYLIVKARSGSDSVIAATITKS